VESYVIDILMSSPDWLEQSTPNGANSPTKPGLGNKTTKGASVFTKSTGLDNLIFGCWCQRNLFKKCKDNWY
jgi:hypothetical protein